MQGTSGPLVPTDGARPVSATAAAARGGVLSEARPSLRRVAPQIASACITASAVVLGLVLQGLVARYTLRQKQAADLRSAHWARIQWAVDKTLSGDAEALEIGMRALETLALDETVEEVDLKVVGTALDIGDPKFRNARAALEAGDDVPDSVEGDG
ncbi:MAG: hypothetical protein JWM64_229 [Frankiales bacterium]|nr:hypothetical protein [Frankiales bacterium]